MITRGIRNNNPGNIKDFGIPWEGMATPEERTIEQAAESVFVVFRAPWYGIRAMAVTLRNYATKHGLRTVEGMLRRWAPKKDNNPEKEYVEFVAGRLGVAVNETIDPEDYDTMRELVRAIVMFENGTDPYSWEYNTGLILAGIEPKV